MASLFLLFSRRRRATTLVRLCSLLAIAGVTVLLLRGLPVHDTRPNQDVLAKKVQPFDHNVALTPDTGRRWRPPIGQNQVLADVYDPDEVDFHAKFRSDWGENGAGVFLKGDEKKQADKEFKRAGFNAYISDRIPLNRSLGNRRHRSCDILTFNVQELPTTSVIIIFTDEIFSALLRTVYSVVNRTPASLLREIILVDDASAIGERNGHCVSC